MINQGSKENNLVLSFDPTDASNAIPNKDFVLLF
jgi:hypothetical protein